MAEKKAVASTLIAGAVAKVLQQGAVKWGVGEHLALVRYCAMDAITQAEKDPASKGKPLGEIVGARLKAEFGKDPEIAYASNFQKLLEKSGDLKASGEYE